MSVISTTYISSNENGVREVHIERDMSILEIIAEAWHRRSFNFDKTTTVEYENIGSVCGVPAHMSDVWLNKKTKAHATDGEMCQILEVQVEYALGRLADRYRK